MTDIILIITSVIVYSLVSILTFCTVISLTVITFVRCMDWFNKCFNTQCCSKTLEKLNEI